MPGPATRIWKAEFLLLTFSDGPPITWTWIASSPIPGAGDLAIPATSLLDFMKRSTEDRPPIWLNTVSNTFLSLDVLFLLGTVRAS